MFGSPHPASFIIHQLLSLFSRDSLVQNFCSSRILHSLQHTLSSSVSKLHEPLPDTRLFLLLSSTPSQLSFPILNEPLLGDHSFVWSCQSLCSFHPLHRCPNLSGLSVFSPFFLGCEYVLHFPAQMGWGSPHTGIGLISCFVVSSLPALAMPCSW